MSRGPYRSRRIDANKRDCALPTAKEMREAFAQFKERRIGAKGRSMNARETISAAADIWLESRGAKAPTTRAMVCH